MPQKVNFTFKGGWCCIICISVNKQPLDMKDKAIFSLQANTSKSLGHLVRIEVIDLLHRQQRPPDLAEGRIECVL